MNLGGYEILGPIGSGGAGTVFRARAPSGEFVAIKVLHRSDVTASARLKRELDVQRSLGDGFVPLLASGAAPQGAFIVMPLIEGGTLRERLKRGPLPLAEAIRLGVELGDALGRAHGSGIIHRDLKPENVLYHSGRPLIADLGLAKLVDSNDSLSRTGDTRGTFGYMPPEQMRDAKRAGPAADVFSLGVVIFECLAGESPFRGETPLLLVDAVEEGRFVPLRKLRPDVPRAVASVIERALAADEDDRFEDGEEFAEALRRAWRKGARPRATLIVVATALAVAGGFGAAILSRPRPLSAPNPAAPPAPPKPPSPTTTTTTPLPAQPPLSRAPRLATVAVLGTSTFRHGAPLTALAARPDRPEIIAGDAQGMVRCWRIPGGEETDTYEVFRPGKILSIAAMSDGAAVILGTGEGPGLVLVDPRPTRLSAISTEGVFAVIAAPNGPRFATIAPGRVQVIDYVKRETLLDIVAPDEGEITAACFRDEDKIDVGTSTGSVYAVHLSEKKFGPRLSKTGGAIRSIVASRDGKALAFLSANGVLRTVHGARRHEISDADPRALAFFADGRLVFHDGARVVNVMNIAGEKIESKRVMKDVAIDPSVGLAVVSHERLAYQIGADPNWGNPFVVSRPRAPGHERLVSVLLPIGRGRLASAGGDGTVRVWDLASGLEVAVHADQKGLIFALLPSLDGRTVVSASASGDLLVRDAETLAPIATRSQRTPLTSATMTGDGRLWGTTGRGARVLTESGPGASLATDFQPVTVRSVGGDLLVGWSEREVRLYDARTGSLRWKRDLGAMCGSWCAIDRVGEDRLALGGGDGTVHLVALATGEPVWPRPVNLVPKGRISVVAASPDGRWILAGGPPDHDVHVLDATDGQEVAKAELPAALDFPACIRFVEGEVLVGTLRGLIVRMKLE